MRNALILEEFSLCALSLLLFRALGFQWWLYVLLFLTPDLSMLGYLGGPRVGATIYNLVHHRALAVGLYLCGSLTGSPALHLAAVILLGHSSLDRVFGYGLKHPDSFQHTHLGVIGRRSGDGEAAWKSN